MAMAEGMASMRSPNIRRPLAGQQWGRDHELVEQCLLGADAIEVLASITSVVAAQSGAGADKHHTAEHLVGIGRRRRQA